MKSIFTKLSTLLLCGAVALVGCSDFSADLRDVNERLEELKESAATKTEVAALKAEVEALSKKLTDQYATKEDVAKVEATVETVKKDLKDAQDAFTAALDNKADKTALETAVKTLQDALTTAKGEFTTALEGLASANQTLKENLQTLVDKVNKLEGDITTELGTIGGNIETLQKDLQDLTYDVEDLQEELDTYKETVDKELKEIKEGFEKRGEELDEKFGDIDEQFTSIGDQLTAINNSLADLANADTDLEAKDKEIEEALDKLEEAFDDFVKNAHQELVDKVNDLIKETTDNYKDLSDRIDALEDALLDLEDKVEDMETELRSIVSIPQMMLNGMNAVEFKSLVFVPMLQDSDEVVPVEGAAEYELIPASTYVYYHFNPSKFNIDYAYYTAVGENVEFITKSASEEVVTVGKVVEEAGKVKVEFFRGKGEGNVFALAATLDNDNVIYSDYVQIIDNLYTAEDFEIVNTDNEVIYATLAEAQNGAYTAQMNVGETHSISEHTEIAGADADEFGLKLKYTLVSGKAQLSAEGEFNAVDAALGTDNIVKIEIVDKDNCVVRRAYSKIRVVGPGVYFQATATASVPAQRVAFEISDIQVWAQLLKDEPDTKNRISQAFEAIKAKDFLTAYELLNGVPGFVKKNTTFTVTVSEKVKMESTLSGTVNSLLPEIKLIDSVEDFTVAVKKLETKYEESALSKLNVELIATFIPQINDLPVVANVLEEILKFRFSSVLENNLVTGVLKTIENYIDFQGIRERLFAIAESLETNTNVNTTATAEAVAKAAAVAKAEAQSVTALMAKIAETNEKVVVDVNNGNWGKLLSLVDNQVVAKIFEVLQLTDVYTTLMDIAGYAESLAQWSYNPLAITVEADPNVERLDVIE